MENHTASLALAEMHPFWCWRTTFPPEGALLAALCFVMLMRSKGKQRANFPRRGKYREAGIGVHFQQAQPGLYVFPSRQRRGFPVLS